MTEGDPSWALFGDDKTDSVQRVMVRIKGAGMFPSGSAALSERFAPLMQRIGEAF